MRSLPLTLRGCDIDIISSCAGPQDDAGKEKDDDKDFVGYDGDAQPHNIVSHVWLPGTDQEKAELSSKDQRRQPPALPPLGKQAGPGGGHRSLEGEGEDRPFWLHAARAGVG